MQARYNRQLKSGNEYAHLFPKASGENITIRKDAEVSHTVALIPKVVQRTLQHTALLAPLLRGATITETCKNIWDFVYQHIAYRKDADGIEQIRSPARTWQDRQQGVDCDCYTTFISSLLTNLNIPHTYRIAKYNHKTYYQHIYPIVPLQNGATITIDCVVEQFNYEEPYTQKQDTKMDLQFLNGIDGNEIYAEPESIDAQELMGSLDDYSSEIGRIHFSLPKIKLAPILSKVAHATNKFNPAIVLLRNGLLASMKLNLFKVAQQLKWAYLSDVDAKNKNIDMLRFEQLKKVRARLESIFYGAGGKPDNLKKAILNGKGNRGKDVNGLGSLSEQDSLSTLLGNDYESVQGLGEPITATAIASAAGIVGAIAGLLKSIGSIFKSKEQEGAQDFDNADNGEKSPTSTVALASEKTVPPSIQDDGTANPASNIAPQTKENAEINAIAKTTNSVEKETATNDDASNTNSSNAIGTQAIWEKNKKWMKPTLIGLGSAGLLYLAYRAMGQHQTTSTPKSKPLQGVKHHNRNTTKRHTTKKNKVGNIKLFN